MAVMEPLRKSPRSTMRDKMALRSCSSAIRESGKLAPLLLTYHYVRNIATKKEPLIIPLSCRTPPCLWDRRQRKLSPWQDFRRQAQTAVPAANTCSRTSPCQLAPSGRDLLLHRAAKSPHPEPLHQSGPTGGATARRSILLGIHRQAL